MRMSYHRNPFHFEAGWYSGENWGLSFPALDYGMKIASFNLVHVGKFRITFEVGNY